MIWILRAPWPPIWPPTLGEPARPPPPNNEKVLRLSILSHRRPWNWFAGKHIHLSTMPFYTLLIWWRIHTWGGMLWNYGIQSIRHRVVKQKECRYGSDSKHGPLHKWVRSLQLNCSNEATIWNMFLSDWKFFKIGHVYSCDCALPHMERDVMKLWDSIH